MGRIDPIKLYRYRDGGEEERGFEMRDVEGRDRARALKAPCMHIH